MEEFEGIVGEMEKRGHKVVEQERAMFLLCEIPEEWRFLRSQIFLKYEFKDLDTEKVKEALREYEVSLRLKGVKEEREEEVGGIDRALYGKKGEKGEKCKKCGRWGHGDKECTTRCYECGEIGHVANRCPKKDQGTKKKLVREYNA